MNHPNAIKLLQKEIERLQGDNAKLDEYEPESFGGYLFWKNATENNKLRIKELQGACMVLVKDGK